MPSKIDFFYRHVMMRARANGLAVDVKIDNLLGEVEQVKWRDIEDVGDGAHFQIEYKYKGRVKKATLHYSQLSFCAPIPKKKKASR